MESRSKDDILREGRASEFILNDEVFVNAVEETEKDIKARWEKAVSAKEREDIWHEQRALKRVLIVLGRNVKDATLLRHQLDTKSKG